VAQAGSDQGPRQAAAAAAAADGEEGERLVTVQLLLRTAAHADTGPLQLQLTVLPAAAAAADATGGSRTRTGLFNRLGLHRSSANAGSSSSSSSSTSQAVQQQGSVVPEAVQQQQQQQGGSEEPLEGDMWSVMSRLKAGSTSMLAAKEDGVAAGAAAAASERVLETGAQLQQQLMYCCKAVCAGAADIKGSLGEESADLLQLVESVKGLLNHGLNNSSSSSSSAPVAGANSSSRGNTPEPGGSSSSVAAAVKAAASARDMLGGLLSHARYQSAFGVSDVNGGEGGVTSRYVRSQQEWHRLPGAELSSQRPS
jgi:hypothetical protein